MSAIVSRASRTPSPSRCGDPPAACRDDPIPSPDTPRLLNSALLTRNEAFALGYQLTIQLGTLTSLIAETRRLYLELAETGRVDLAARSPLSVDEIARTLGMDRYREAEDAALGPPS